MTIDPQSSGIEQQQPASSGEQKSDCQYQFLWPAKIRKAISDKLESYRDKNKSPEYRREKREIWTTRWLFLTVVFTFVTALIFYCQLHEMEKVYGPVQASAEAAKKAANVAERALIDVERPIILAEITNDFQIGWGSPQITLQINNAGKQLGLINVATSNLNLQETTLPPADLNFSKDGACVFFFVGQLVMKPDQSKTFSCIRNTAITPQEAIALAKGSLYAFYVVNIVYEDLIGSSRSLIQVFLVRPHGNIGKFVQVGMREENNRDITPEQRANNERVFVDTILQIERDRGMPFPDP